jgi:hypothetical protein
MRYIVNNYNDLSSYILGDMVDDIPLFEYYYLQKMVFKTPIMLGKNADLSDLFKSKNLSTEFGKYNVSTQAILAGLVKETKKHRRVDLKEIIEAVADERNKYAKKYLKKNGDERKCSDYGNFIDMFQYALFIQNLDWFDLLKLPRGCMKEIMGADNTSDTPRIKAVGTPEFWNNPVQKIENFRANLR